MDGELRKAFREGLRAWHWQSIESALTGAGIPDSNYCCHGVEGWLELKKADGWKVKFQVMQPAWIMRRVREGGRVHIAVRQTRTDILYLYWGGSVVALRDGNLKTVPPLAQWKRPWPWQEIGELILQGNAVR